jgi:hypothetical protein
MRFELRAAQIAKLPVHDAELLSIRIDTGPNGDSACEILICIDAEESMQPFFELGIQTQLVRLRFENCWQFISNLLSYQTRRDQVSQWYATSESDRIDVIRSSCGTSETVFLHHTFEFAGGSTFEIIAERVSIEDTISEPA